ncbi:hypothetical protein [Herbaspirillum chlorophenolicum]|uniref:hypothetical protein n=1 Tax=Herbaspirillum chlorophenolicum TaxID=211589 RepID=UPI00067D45C6|nr:hypothetical protein [Herbaspirillum chlorophenolicum]
MTRQDQLAQLAQEFSGPALNAWPTDRAGKLRPHKGGGGDDGGAREMENQRQQRVADATNRISQIFDSANRDALYGQQKQAVYDLNTQDVNRQFGEAERANRFGLARAGLLGGSADIDSNAELTRRTNEGLVKAAGIGDQAAADLQTSDERARQNLISMAQSGIDTGAAGQLALQQLDANTANASSARSGATVGNLFGDLANAYLYGQQQKGVQAGLAPYTNFQPGVTNGNTRSSYGGTQ